MQYDKQTHRDEHTNISKLLYTNNDLLSLLGTVTAAPYREDAECSLSNTVSNANFKKIQQGGVGEGRTLNGPSIIHHCILYIL